MKFHGLSALARKFEKEFLLSDGRGGYLFLPSDGLLRRKYHGLWTASLNPPFNRHVLLSGFRIFSDGELIGSQLPEDGLGAIMAYLEGQRASLIYPNGLEVKLGFSEGLEVHFSEPVEVEPLLSMRHIYEVNRDLGGFEAKEGRVERHGISLEIGLSFEGEAKSYEVEYEIDRERGEEFRDLLLSPGRVKVEEGLLVRFEAYSKVKRGQDFGPLDQFLARGPYARRFLMAGYPWFGVWTRDSLISVPGLLTCRGRYAEARGVMLSLLSYERDGELPEFLGERDGRPAYGSADSTFWLAYSLRHYLQYTDDVGFLEKIFPALKRIVRRYGKDVVRHGPATWMDVRIDGRFVVDRSGTAVEVQALWIDLLELYEKACRRLGMKCEVEGLARRLLDEFEEAFWNGRWYRDTLEDDRLRPNQLIALSLLPLKEERGRKALEEIWKKLATPFGVRTLSPEEPSYRGRYEGDQRSRDLAYHNGTAWPWLSGFLSRASVKYGYERGKVFRASIQPLLAYMEESFGCLAEIFDGDEPHRPDGCVTQAWSVAEAYRAYYEDYLGRRPRYWRRWAFRQL